MFPTAQEQEEFRKEFGRESSIQRIRIRGRGTWGISIAATVLSESTREETLNCAWYLALELSKWILARSHLLTPEERVIVIVGWSALVRPKQGQIFKIGGTVDDLRKLAACEQWKSARKLSGQQIPLLGWEKDVFAKTGGPAESNQS
jgi:hypothetical protein